MKIERINENQIRCTLTPADLLGHHLTLKKLASGNEDAQLLFREMIERSYEEVGFEPNEYPFLIEASAFTEGNLVLTITRVNSADEYPQANQPAGILRMLQYIASVLEQKPQSGTEGEGSAAGTAVYAFESSRPIQLPRNYPQDPKGVCTSLYYAPKSRTYYLAVTCDPSASEPFRVLCNELSEYARSVPAMPGTKIYFEEHYTTVFAKNALRRVRESPPSPDGFAGSQK